MTTSKLIAFACLLAVANARSFDNFNSYVSKLSIRIIGGHNAKEDEFPHQVSLQFKRPSQNISYRHFCGGSIISDQWIMTAAHCVEIFDQVPPDVIFAVKAGKYDLTNTEDTEQTSIVAKHFIHERYKEIPELPISTYDIGLIKLKTPFQLNKRVAVIDLPEKNSEPQGIVTLSGWGAVDSDEENPEMPYILQTVNLTIVDRAACNAAIAKVFKEEQGFDLPIDLVDQTNVCSGPITGGISACGGDSGGPLITKDSNGKTTVVGIVSWGMKPCGRKGAPSVYARTSFFIDWIQNIIDEN